MEEEKRKNLTQEGLRQMMLHKFRISTIVITLIVAVAAAIWFSFTRLIYREFPDAWLAWGVFVVIDASIVIAWAVFFINVLKNWRLVATGRFSIVEDTLVGIGVDEIKMKHFLLGFGRRHRPRTQLEDALYFAEHGRVVTTRQTCEMSCVGDTFYLIVYRDKKQTVAGHYSTKLYYYQPDAHEE